MTEFTFKSFPFSDEEIQSVANIHHQCLSTSFLSQLGPGFLFFLYKSISECTGTELVIAKSKNDVIGFITGSTSLRPVYKHLIKRYFVQITFSVLPHLFSLKKIKKIIEILSYSKSENIKYSTTELLSLAVKDEYRRYGVAKELFKQLTNQFGKKGLKEFRIIVGEELLRAQLFYEKMGALKIGTIELHQGTQSVLYKVEI